MKINSIKIKTLAWFIGIVATILVLFSYLLFYFMENSIKDSVAQELKSTITLLSNNKKANLGKIKLNIIKDGKSIYQSEKFEKMPYKEDGLYFFYIDNEDYALFIKTIKNKKYISYIEDYDKQKDNLEKALVVFNIAIVLLLIYFANRALDKVLTPINKVTESANNISVSNFIEPIENS